MPSISAKVEQVRAVKNGTANGRPWTLYVVEAGDREYTTFDSKWQAQVGKIVQLTYEEVPKGKYVNYRLVESKEQSGGDHAALLSEIRILLLEIKEMVYEIRHPVGAGGAEVPF